MLRAISVSYTHLDVYKRQYLYNGNRLRPEMFLEEHESMRMAPVRVYDDEGAFFGIYEYQAEKEDYKPLKVFK